MFFLRGVSYLVSEESIPITTPFMTRSQALHGKSLAAVAKCDGAADAGGGGYRHIPRACTRFGNQVYAIGGNATSANLWGFPLAAPLFAFICSPPDWHAGGDCLLDLYPGRICAGGRSVELDAIASVVIGGTLLSGG